GDGKKASGPVAHLIDGTDDTTWNADRGAGRRNQPSVVVVQFEQPLQFPAGTELKLAWRNGEMLGCCRFSITRQPAPAAPAGSQAAMLAPPPRVTSRTAEQQAAFFPAGRAPLAEAKPINDEIDALWNTFPQAATSILHLTEQDPANRRKTHLLDRGNWDQP